MERYADQLNGSEDLFGLIVDGAALTLIMPFQDNRNLLYQVALIYHHSILVIADTYFTRRLDFLKCNVA